jgi:short-subunit dehydrogenase
LDPALDGSHETGKQPRERFGVALREKRLTLRKSFMAEEWRDKWALVTGASAGIGVALAKELAAGGTNLVLTARRADRLAQLADQLQKQYRISTEVVVADLAEPGAPDEIYNFTHGKKLAIELLINNAGFGQYGELTQIEVQRLLDMVQVNCASVVHLTRLYLAEMIARRRGDVLILASTASFQAVPYISTYAATKAFDLIFAEGLAEEMRPYGIRVCALCPGTTESEFHAAAGQQEFTRKHRQETAEKVAKTGLRALAAGKSWVISGTANYWGANLQRLVPRGVVTRIAANMFRPKSKP